MKKKPLMDNITKIQSGLIALFASVLLLILMVPRTNKSIQAIKHIHIINRRGWRFESFYLSEICFVCTRTIKTQRRF